MHQPPQPNAEPNKINRSIVGTTIVKAGDIVKIIIPSVAAVKTTKNETQDMLYNGNFLIRSIRHDFNIIDEKHTMSMNVTKDAMGVTYENYDEDVV